MRSKGKRHSYKTFQEFERRKSKGFDYVILGSSQAYRGYDPRIFRQEGIRVHNLGTSSQRFMHSAIIGCNYINKEITERVIIDLYTGTFSGSLMEATVNLVQNIPTIRGAFEVGFHTQDVRCANMFMLRALDDLFLEKSQIDTSVNYYDLSRYISGGYAETTDSLMTVEKEDYNVIYKNNPPHFKYLHKVLKHFEKESIPVTLVFTPLPKEFVAKNIEAFVDEVEQIAKDYDDVRVLNFANTLNLDSRYHFFDHRHLNQSGVEIFNTALIRELKKLE